MVSGVREPRSPLEVRRILQRLAALEARINALPLGESEAGGGGGFEWWNQYRIAATWNGTAWELVEGGGFDEIWVLVHGVLWPCEQVDVVDSAEGTFLVYDQDGQGIRTDSRVEAIVRRLAA
ncbi:hypothetical protein HS125_04500 [bacterium]|nr:hypothetical protein [bacterium]